MASLTADELVLRERQLLQTFNSDNLQYRDGFSDDATASDPVVTPLLASINDFLSLVSMTRCNMTNSLITIAAGTREYDIPLTVIELTSAYHGRALKKTSRAHKDAMDPIWYTRTGYPLEYIREANTITLTPFPDATVAVGVLMFTCYGLFLAICPDA